MQSLVLSKKFNPFVNNFQDIFLNYKKHFYLPNCFIDKKICKCFSKRKEIEFSFDYPMSFIQLYKKHITKNIYASEKHNNLNILALRKTSNLVKRKFIKITIIDHLETLNIFLKFISTVEKSLSSSIRIKYQKYIKKRILLCENYLTSIKKQSLEHFTPFVVLNMSFYNHYHTLKLFESFVNKLK